MSQGPINLGGVGDIDIDPEQTEALLRLLHAAGGTFGRAVGPAEAAIGHGEQESKTGFDTLSKNFRANYNASKPQFEELNPTVQPLIETKAANGITAVGEYVRQAERDAARLRSLE